MKNILNMSELLCDLSKKIRQTSLLLLSVDEVSFRWNDAVSNILTLPPQTPLISQKALEQDYFYDHVDLYSHGI